VNPLDVIEQITYLMFIHDLDDSDNLRAKEAAMLGLPYKSIFADQVQIGDRTVDGQQLKWSVFHDFPAGKMYSVRSIVDVFSDLSLWAGIRKVIDSVNANALAVRNGLS
jgi:hypothetical protein